MKLSKVIDSKTGLGLILILVMLFWFKSALALRCGNTLIDDNMPLYEVQQACKGGYTYHVQNDNADITKYYYNENGMNHEMVFIDGNLKEDNENIDMKP